MVKEKNTLTCVKTMSRWLNTKQWKSPQDLVGLGQSVIAQKPNIDPEVYQRNQKIWADAKKNSKRKLTGSGGILVRRCI